MSDAIDLFFYIWTILSCTSHKPPTFVQSKGVSSEFGSREPKTPWWFSPLGTKNPLMVSENPKSWASSQKFVQHHIFLNSLTRVQKYIADLKEHKWLCVWGFSVLKIQIGFRIFGNGNHHRVPSSWEPGTNINSLQKENIKLSKYFSTFEKA